MRVNIGYQVAPGHCFVCHNPDSSQVTVDLEQDDLSVVKRHRVYLCSGCVKAAAMELEKSGHVDWRVLDAAEVDVLRDAQATSETAVAALAAMHDKIAHVRAIAQGLEP
jgi:uncharacterized protein YunC (DUF1805 family)